MINVKVDADNAGGCLGEEFHDRTECGQRTCASIRSPRGLGNSYRNVRRCVNNLKASSTTNLDLTHNGVSNSSPMDAGRKENSQLIAKKKTFRRLTRAIQR